jgi:ABC-type nitrate/sulfonate/bicarbonate transport system substrate-binding protein
MATVRRRRQLAVVVTAVVVAGVPLGARGATVAGAATTACAAPSKVTIGELPVPVNLDMVAAQGLGLFTQVGKECNTSISLQVFASPPTEVPALVSGQIQYGDPGAANIIAAAGQKQKILALVGTAQGGTGFLIASSANKSKGTLLKGIANYVKGATYAVPALGGPGELSAQMLISAAGGDPSGVRFVAVGVPGLVSAVESNKASVATTSPAPALAAIAAKKAYSLIYTSGPYYYKKFGFLPGTLFSTTPAFAGKYPVLTQKLATAEVQALLTLQKDFKNPGASYKLLPSSYQATETEAVWASSWAYTDGVNAPATGLVTQANLQTELNYETKYSILPKGTTLTPNMTDSAYVKTAYKTLGEPSPTGTIDANVLNEVPNT